MVRLFQVYVPIRQLLLLASETVIVLGSFFAAAALMLGPETYTVLNYDNGLYKLLVVSGFALLYAYYFDLYSPHRLTCGAETYVRLLVMLSFLCLTVSALTVLFPRFAVGRYVFVVGILILTTALLAWRTLYGWLMQRPYLREHVFVLGRGDRANRLVQTLRGRGDAVEVVGWDDSIVAQELQPEAYSEMIRSLTRDDVSRVIVALTDRRGMLPARDLLDLRLRGVKVEDAAGVLERLTGRIDVDALHPSFLIFSDGFSVSEGVLLARRIISIIGSLVLLIICAPLLPLIALAIRLTSPGPVLFRQERVGRKNEVFILYKFRTMRADAEANGAQWAKSDDPRVTRVGRFLRATRLDELPQLWNLFKGDMGFVGPRPERPEFVQWLSGTIPYYQLRHMIRPGLTGWAQVRYRYGASVEETKEKLAYDLYYLKHMSVALDLFIIFETIKTVLRARGSR